MTDESIVPARRTAGAAFFGTATQGLPPWVPPLLRRIALIIITLVVVWNIARALRGFLTLILISFFLATALEPAVAYLSKRGWRRGLATGVIFVGAGIVVVGFIGLMVPLTVDQTLRLVERIPSYLDSLAEFLARFDIEFDVDQVGAALTSVDSSLESVSRDVLGSVFGVGSRLLSTFLELLTIGLFTFYITADAPRLRRTLLSVLTPERQREVLHVVEIAIEKTGGYFYSRALLAGLASLVTWLVLTLLDVPFALPLGIWVGVISQFIPVIGTYLGGILPVLIALLEDPWDALWVIVFILVYQQIENYLIAPRVTARTMALHPAVAFGSAIVGGTMMGVAGAVMALPVAATIQAYISTYLHRHELIESHLFDEPVTTASGLVKPPRVDGDA